jgi:hypothetical protein
MEKQIGLMLDLIFDVATRDEPKGLIQKKILDMISMNGRYEEPFTEFISWFKIEEEEEQGNLSDDTVQP